MHRSRAATLASQVPPPCRQADNSSRSFGNSPQVAAATSIRGGPRTAPTIRWPIEEPTPAAIECLNVSPRLGAAIVVTDRTGATGATGRTERTGLERELERGILLFPSKTPLGR
jgi:hypothetical protein